MDRDENLESFRGRIRPNFRRAYINSSNSYNSNSNDNNNHPVEGIEDALSSLSLSNDRNYLNSGGVCVAGGENGSLSLYNGENFSLPDGVADYYYNRDVPVQDFIGFSNYFSVPSTINGNIFSSSNSNGLYNGTSLQGLENFQCLNQNGIAAVYERNWFAPSRGYSTRNSVVPFPSFNQNRYRRHGGGVLIDPRGVNANGGFSARNRAVQQGFEGVCLSDLRGKIVSLAKDQAGYRILHSMIDNIDDDGVAMILAEVISRISELMVDEFGNYIVQKLVEICSDEQRNQILLSVTRIEFQLIRICLNMHGTRVVQKLLKHLTSQQQISLVVSALRPGVVHLIKDNNGHHVIDFCVKHFSSEDIEFLLNEVVKNCYAIATDKSGCCVLQSCVANSKGEARERIVAEIIRNSRLLAVDSYGNYVVQHAIEQKEPGTTAKLLRELQGQFISLSRNKYGSNVVERFLNETGDQHSTKIITELLRSPNASILLTDPYGNYVIQTALSVTQAGPVYNAIVKLIEMNASAMQTNLFGKKILTWFQRRQPDNMHRYRNVLH